MSNNSLFVWQVRVWSLALAAVLVFANAHPPAADKAAARLSIADQQACVTARGPIVRAQLAAIRPVPASRKCRDAKVVEDASVPHAIGG